MTSATPVELNYFIRSSKYINFMYFTSRLADIKKLNGEERILQQGPCLNTTIETNCLRVKVKSR